MVAALTEKIVRWFHRRRPYYQMVAALEEDANGELEHVKSLTRERQRRNGQTLDQLAASIQETMADGR